MRKKVVIVTTGQPSTNPRMIKEVDVLLANGYWVTVFYSFWTLWAVKYDLEIIKRYPAGTFLEVGGNPINAKLTYFFSKVLHKFFLRASAIVPLFAKYAVSRSAFFLEKAALAAKADLFIGHNLGALPAVVTAAQRSKAVCGFDAEDFHRGEYFDKSASGYKRTILLEDKYMPRCNYVTAASPLIAQAYNTLYAINVNTINNVFSIKYLQALPEIQPSKGLRIFWFSQTIGPNRGLELIVRAINDLPERNISLHLLGNCSEPYKNELVALLKNKDSVQFLPPVEASFLFSVAAKFDIGLAAEEPHSDNRDICLTNKIFTYLLAGNAILASDTQAQKDFLTQYPKVGVLYENNSCASVIEQLSFLSKNISFVKQAKVEALKLASEELNWENESKKFLDIISDF